MREVIKYAFDNKILSDGRSLFRRKHGLVRECPVGETSVKFEVPYDVCKIDEVEIINCEALDKVDLKVLDSSTGIISGYPSVLLNQFGFDVVVSDIYYTDTSSYDAELVKGLEIEIIFKNMGANTKQVGFNFVLHEVK